MTLEKENGKETIKESIGMVKIQSKNGILAGINDEEEKRKRYCRRSY